MSPTRAWILVGAPVCALALAACGGEGDAVRTISEPRIVEPVGRDFRWNATTTQRFGLRDMGPGDGALAESDPHLHWKTPPGWQELPSTALRQANFRPTGEATTECYLTILAGDGGGLEANINRWRKQMSLAGQSAEEIATLPRREFFGEEALFVDLEGTWTGMGGDQGEAGYRMVGLATIGGDRARFLKMVGPADTVAAELDAFEALARSFEEDSGTHGPAEAVAAAGGERGGGMAWVTPEGWSRSADKPMRAVTFQIGGDSECYVALLGGDGGGVAANVNRWRSQMGREDLSTAELNALPRVPMLGAEGILVEIEGHFEGMAGETTADATMLGAVCLLGDRSVFVKLVGPTARVAQEQERFAAFCKSLKEDR